MNHIISLPYLKFSTCESKVKSVSRRAWTSWGFVEKNSENKARRQVLIPQARIKGVRVMLFLSTCNNLVHCPVTLPRMRPPSQAVPMPTVCQSPYHTLGRCRVEANRPRREYVCPGSCTASTAITLSSWMAPMPPERRESRTTLCLAQGGCLLPAAHKGHAESLLLLLSQPPLQGKETTTGPLGSTHLVWG